MPVEQQDVPAAGTASTMIDVFASERVFMWSSIRTRKSVTGAVPTYGSATINLAVTTTSIRT
jgi:hypothetical protein